MTDSTTEPGAPAPAWADLDAFRADHRARNPIPAAREVPPELVARPQWLIWRYEPNERKPGGKPLKVPYYPRFGKRHSDQGSPGDRQKLATYEQAAQFALKRGFDGVGFAFLPGDGLVGIDLDGMIDAESGEISAELGEIVSACASYTEYSPSGKGVHIICLGESETFKSNDIGVEVFAGRQYFTFTGRPYGERLPLQAVSSSALSMLRGKVEAARKARRAAPPGREEAAVAQPAKPAANVGGRQRSLAETVALAEEALTHLSPEGYHDWIEIGMALKEGLGDRYGLMVWDAWSSSSAKYAGQGETADKWASFKPSQITLGSVFERARQAGWEAPWDKAKARKRSKPAPAGLPPESASTPNKATAEEGKSSAGGPPSEVPPGGEDPPPEAPQDPDWARGLLKKNERVLGCLANAELILANASMWSGVLAYDEFAEKTVHLVAPPFAVRGPDKGDWSDHLDDRATIWLQRAFRAEFSTAAVGKAVEVRARENRIHPVRDFLESLPPWDGIRRTGDWISDFLPVEKTAYTALVGTFFLRGMIRRVMQPGCKFDYCLIFEGLQGKGKSSLARTLAWDWFQDTDLDFENKDALLQLPGVWVYEMAELGSLMRSEERKQKSFLTRQSDKYRPPYGKRMIEVPRQCVFIGTTNEEEYLKDPTGGRRFWPIAVGDGDLDLEGLKAMLPMLYAEALADFKAGERYWPTREEEAAYFTPEQAKRGLPEPLEDPIWRWVKQQTAPFSIADLAMDGLKLTPDKLTVPLATRLGIALKKIGCGRAPEDRHAADPGRRRLYTSPVMEKAQAAVSRPSEEEVPDGYF